MGFKKFPVLFLLLFVITPPSFLCLSTGQARAVDRNEPPVTVTSWFSPDGSRPTLFVDTAKSTSGLDATLVHAASSVKLGRPRVPSNQPMICIIVNSSIYALINLPLQQYITDLETSGFMVTTFSISRGTPNEVRELLQSLWSSGLVGCLMVGKTPAAWFRIPAHPDWGAEEFPVDLFYMDLDGSWIDSDHDGLYEDHQGNIAPEIWVGRVDFSNITGDEVSLTVNYFDKVHRYKDGQLYVPKRALIYVDDDWAGMAADVNQSLWTMYRDTTVVNDTLTTNASDYEQRLMTEYEWVHLQCHGWSGGHIFNDDGVVYSSDYRSLDAPVLFYQFFVCSGARFVESNNLATSSIATTNYGLLAVGSAKTGSMLNFEDFYDSLAAGEDIGNSFKTWFSKHISHDWSRDWFYGLTIIGDPTLYTNIREAKVEGYVKNENLSPLSGFKIQLLDYNNSTMYAEDYTDNIGHYEFRIDIAKGAILPVRIEMTSVPNGYFNYSSTRIVLSSDYSRVVRFNITATKVYSGPRVLVVVDNDGSSCFQPGVNPDSIQQVLDTLPFSYSIWTEKDQGLPPMSLLESSNSIFWHTGTYWDYAIDPRDRANVIELSHRGNLSLVMEGEDIGFDWQNDTLLTDVSGVYYAVDDVGVDHVRITNPEHPLAKGLPDIFVFPVKPPYPDGILPRADVVEVAKYYNGTKGEDTSFSAITAYESNGSRVAFVAFPVHWLETSLRKTLIRNLVLWETLGTWGSSIVCFESAMNKLQSGGSWSKVADPLSFSDFVMKASSFSKNSGYLFGPYITEGWDGTSMLGKPYIATFRLKVSSNLLVSDVVSIDICCNAGTLLKWITLRAVDFASSNVWQNFNLTFTVPSSLIYGLEFRVRNLNSGIADVLVDYICVSQGWSTSTIYFDGAMNKPRSGSSWSMVSDSSSWSGMVMTARASSPNGGCLYGPYITTDWSGRIMLGRPFAATFRLKTSSITSSNDLVNVDVCYNAGTVLQSMTIKANDFAAPNTWQDFKISFIAPKSMIYGFEFRVRNLNNGLADIYVDCISVERQWNASSVYIEAAYGKQVTGNSWSKVIDPSSLSGTVMKASGSSSNGAWLYGPYIREDSQGESVLGKLYAASLRLKVSSNIPTNNVAYIDVCYNGGATIIQSRTLKASDFSSPNTWQEFQLSFAAPNTMTAGLEFRVENLNNGVADLCVDYISVSPRWNASTAYAEGAYNKQRSGGSWSNVNDPSSWSGIVMKAAASSPNSGCLYGPYISSDWNARSMLGKSYVVSFRLKVSSNLATDNVVRVDVCYNAGTVLQLMFIKASDFTSSNTWQDFQLAFTTPSYLTYGLEFRVVNLNNGVTDIFADQLVVNLIE